MAFFKNFVMKKMVQSKMKGVPQEQQDKILSALEKDPAFFEQMSKEIETLKKQGKSELASSMEVMRKHQDKLRSLMQ